MFVDALRQCPAAAWTAARDTILPDVHPVDAAALRIWWLFFPLALSDAYDRGESAMAVDRQLRIEGNARLASGQVDTSHRFLYGHRDWPAIRAMLVERARHPDAAATLDLTSEVRQLAVAAARAGGGEIGLTLAIALVGLMTLRQAGLAAFMDPGASPDTDPGAAAGPSVETAIPALAGGAPAPEIVGRRGRDDRQGPLRIFRNSSRYSVVFDECDADARFTIRDGQDLTTAAALDGRACTLGPRRFHEGPIPAQCRSATCGTCWVGVIGGADKLSEVEPHEARRLRAFGYFEPTSPRPLIRLACQARASGNVTIVIPPWNGVVARLYPDGNLPRSGERS